MVLCQGVFERVLSPNWNSVAVETEVVVVVAPEVTTTTKTTVVPKKNFVKTKEIAVFNSTEVVVVLEEGVFL